MRDEDSITRESNGRQGGANRTDPATTAERPLVIRCGAFGDMVLLTAMIRVLHARWGRPVDVVTSGPWSEPLLAGQPGVGEVIALRSRKTPYWLAPDQRRLVRWLRTRGVTATWLCDDSEEMRALLARAGVPAHAVVDVRNHPLLAGEHATEQWRRIAAITPLLWSHRDPAGDFSVRDGCELVVPDAERGALAAWLERRGLAGAPLILIQAGNKRTLRRGLRRLAPNPKYWPSERWAAVIRAIADERPDARIVLLGTGPELALNEHIAALAGIARVHNAADDLPVARLIALLERAEALISVDSGPAHAAAAVGCPTIVLFGRASPSLYRPRGAAGAPVRLIRREAGGEALMLAIEVDDVVDAWRSLAASLSASPASYRR